MGIESGQATPEGAKLTKKLFVGFPFGLHQTDIFVPAEPIPQSRASSWEVGREKTMHETARGTVEMASIDQSTEQEEPVTEVVLIEDKPSALEA